jgi:hypothetical protein
MKQLSTLTRVVLWVAGVFLCPLRAAPQRPVDAVMGSWEGESKCTVADSPCRDEHVIYKVSEAGGGSLKIDAYKVVGGENQFMGTLACSFQDALRCSFRSDKDDDWVFHVSGQEMTGTLTLRSRKLVYRKVAVHRQEPAR